MLNNFPIFCWPGFLEVYMESKINFSRIKPMLHTLYKVCAACNFITWEMKVAGAQITLLICWTLC